MKQNILVVYATKFGSTKEVAERIAELIKEQKVPVEVRKVNNIKDLSKYSAVIFGTAIRMGKPISEAFAFAREFNGELNKMPVAFFSVGLYMKEDTSENREKALKCLTPLLDQIRNPVSVGLFGGKIDYSTMPVLLRVLFEKDKSGDLSEGDWRNWDTIGDWVREILPLLHQSEQ